MKARELDKVIEIMRAGPDVDDGYTTHPGEPAVWKTVAAKLRPAPGQERLQSAQTAADAPMVFRIRWQSALDPNAPTGLNPKDKVRYPKGDAGRVFDIASVIEIGRHDAIEIAATVRTDAEPVP